MKQAIMTKPEKIVFKEVEIPDISSHEVLLKIYRIGVCGSDVHVWHGKHPYTSYPVIQGHEFSATVEAIGKDVKDLKVGSKVTAIPQIICGECGPCKRGDYHICDSLKVQGFQAPGVAQDYFKSTIDKIVKLPENFTFEQGAFVEPVSVAVHAVKKLENIKNENVVVLGAGPIGNLVAQVAKAYGGNILITDLSDFRLEVAQRCGLENISNAEKETLSEAAKRVFKTVNFNYAFECVGVEATITSAIESIGKGGELVVVGVFGEKPKLNVGLIQDRELKITGTLMYKRDDYVEAVKLIDERYINLEPLYSKHFDFYEYSKAYEVIDKEGDKMMKVFIDVN
jgi:L-iditol 2-dehydrogenase